MTIVPAILAGVFLVSAAPAVNASSSHYTMAATYGCLANLPGAIVGLPPVTPTSESALFVHRFARDRFGPPVVGLLGVWYGHRREGDFHQISLSFFRTASAARRFLASGYISFFYRSAVVGNVVVTSSRISVPEASIWPLHVRGCLRAEALSKSHGVTRSAWNATLATFGGWWGGHTRRLLITSDGRGDEFASGGCCDPYYHLTFQILSVRGTVTDAIASYRVVSLKRYHEEFRRLRPDQIGTLVLKDGILTNRLTEDYFCSGAAWGATGVCGA
jgi:hypothetical protein